MLGQLFKSKGFTFERTYGAPIDTVWQAWTQPELLREWWGPENTSIPECEVDLRVGGRIYIVMEAGEAMGKYEGTRWPLEGRFTRIDRPHHLAYEARSWTEGEESAYVEHLTEVTLAEVDGGTALDLRISVNEIGAGVKAALASYGMKWGYKAQLDKLEALLAR